jgi:peptide/nickel transport system substrate-binding protein
MSCRSHVLALVILAIVAVPCSAAAQGTPLRVGLGSIPTVLDPATALEGSVPLIARQVFDTLLQYREGSSDVEPGLATSWSVSRDGLSWTFRLRDGVRFHDGTPLTSREVAESLDRIIVPNHALAPAPNPGGLRLLRGSPGVVKEILTPDSRTVQINLLLPYAPILSVLAHPVFSIVHAGTGAARWIGTGAYSVSEMSPGRIVLDANPSYWAAPPRTPRIQLLEAGDPARAEADVEARNLDILIPASAPSRMQGALSVASWRIGYLAVQHEREPFKRKKVRQAITSALSAAAITAAVEPQAIASSLFLPRGVWASADTPPLAGADAAAAKRLMGEAGVGQGVTASLVADAGAGPEVARAAEAIRTALAAVSITVNLRALATDAALHAMQNGTYDLALAEAQAEGGDPHLLLYPLSTSEGAVRGPTATNFSFYRNARLDDLLIRASQISFRPERLRVYGRAQAFLAEEIPWIPLYVRLHWAVVRPEVRNFRLHPSGNHRLDRAWIEIPQPLPPAPPPRTP